MRALHFLVVISTLVVCCLRPLGAQEADTVISVRAPLIALTHANLIDGRGGPARADQTILIRDGRIAAVGATAEIAIPTGAQTLDLAWNSVMPGLVMLHEHLFFTARATTTSSRHLSEMG